MESLTGGSPAQILISLKRNSSFLCMENGREGAGAHPGFPNGLGSQGARSQGKAREPGSPGLDTKMAKVSLLQATT